MTPNPSRRLFLGAAASVPLALTLGVPAAHAADSAYVMSYFTESTDLGAAPTTASISPSAPTVCAGCR